MTHLANNSGLAADIQGHPAFAAGSAYERTKIACAVLVRHGQPVPAWSTLRELYTNKGSATDINRGIKDFRREHGEHLQTLESMPGVPQALVTQMQSLWTNAVAGATALYTDAKATLEASLEEAERARDNAEACCRIAESKVETLTTAKASLQQEVEQERVARARAERAATDLLLDLKNQRDTMEQALKENALQIRKLLEQHDAERRHALSRVEEVRAQEEARRVEQLAAQKSEYRNIISNLEIEKARLQKRLFEKPKEEPKTFLREKIHIRPRRLNISR